MASPGPGGAGRQLREHRRITDRVRPVEWEESRKAPLLFLSPAQPIPPSAPLRLPNDLRIHAAFDFVEHHISSLTPVLVLVVLALYVLSFLVTRHIYRHMEF